MNTPSSPSTPDLRHPTFAFVYACHPCKRRSPLPPSEARGLRCMNCGAEYTRTSALAAMNMALDEEPGVPSPERPLHGKAAARLVFYTLSIAAIFAAAGYIVENDNVQALLWIASAMCVLGLQMVARSHG